MLSGFLRAGWSPVRRARGTSFLHTRGRQGRIRVDGPLVTEAPLLQWRVGVWVCAAAGGFEVGEPVEVGELEGVEGRSMLPLLRVRARKGYCCWLEDGESKTSGRSRWRSRQVDGNRGWRQIEGGGSRRRWQIDGVAGRRRLHAADRDRKKDKKTRGESRGGAG